ncbi:MAG: hypothetical protein WDN49_02450 [Acetobacteraceae bacterium]
MMTVGAIAGPLIGLLVSDRVGRRRGLMLTALFCGVVGLVYSQQGSAFGVVACGFLLVTGMTLMISFGVGAYTAELFPHGIPLSRHRPGADDRGASPRSCRPMPC